MRRLGIICLLVLLGAALWSLPGWRTGQRSAPFQRPAAKLPDVEMAEEANSAHARTAQLTMPVVLAEKEASLLAFFSDADRPLPFRLEAVDGLTAEPAPAALLESLGAYLRSPVPSDEHAAARERALRNHLLNRLREHVGHAHVLVPALAGQLADARQDPALRDYAAQHLAAWLPDLREPAKSSAEEALRSAVRDSVFTLPGTSLLGLHDLSVRGVLAEPFDSRAESLRMALDPSLSLSSRITALSLSAELGVASEDLMRLATAWAQAPDLPLGARLAAQALLRAAQPSP